MSSGDFTYLTLRNMTAYQLNNTFVPSGYILTTSSNGKGSWVQADKVLFNSLSTSAATSGPAMSTIAAAVLTPSTISSMISNITSNIMANGNIYNIVSSIVGESLSKSSDELSLTKVVFK